MIDLSSIRVDDCKDSKYIKMQRISYIENGAAKTWDVVRSMDSVSILIYNQDIDSVVIVRQFRPSVFLRNNDGYMYELCAGLVDKEGKSVEQIAIEEVSEECGYKVDKLEKIAEFYSSVGTSGSRQSMFYVSVTNDDRISSGGGVEDEFIEIINVARKNMSEILLKDNITPSLAFAFMWFMHHKKHIRKQS